MKKFLLGACALFAASQLMAGTFNDMPGITENDNVWCINHGIEANIGIERINIHNSGLDATNAAVIRSQIPVKDIIFGKNIYSIWGQEIAYTRMKPNDGGERASFLKIATYKEWGLNLRDASNIFTPYVGAKIQLEGIGGLSHKGIGAGAFVGIHFTHSRITTSIQTGVARDYFEGGNWFRETTTSFTVGYCF